MRDAIYPGGLRVPLAYARTSGLVALALGVFVLFGLVEPAAADFRLCNNTGSRVGVAIGYKDADGWTTEGWWNLPSRTCETILKGNLVARYYYVYAIDYDHGGEWMGQAYMCTRDKEFTIRGISNCLARGYDRTGFFEVDTGQQQAWTVQLTETGEQPAATPLPSGNPLTRIPPAGARAPHQTGPLFGTGARRVPKKHESPQPRTDARARGDDPFRRGGEQPADRH